MKFLSSLCHFLHNEGKISVGTDHKATQCEHEYWIQLAQDVGFVKTAINY
jgi:hypothetical protein